MDAHCSWDAPFYLAEHVSGWTQGKKCHCAISPFIVAVEDTLLCWHGNLRCPQVSFSMSGTGISSPRWGSCKSIYQTCDSVPAARCLQQWRLWSCLGNIPAVPRSWPGLLMASETVCLLTCSQDPSIVGLMNVTSCSCRPGWPCPGPSGWTPRNHTGETQRGVWTSFLSHVGACGFLRVSARTMDQHHFCSP